ncbi:hypothetical protein OROHE_006287 [Orobanche hederae]
MEVGVKVLFKDMFTLNYIAKGSVQSLNPSKLVGNEEVGQHWCEVKVTMPIKYGHAIIRKIKSIKVIGQAIGSRLLGQIIWLKWKVQ